MGRLPRSELGSTWRVNPTDKEATMAAATLAPFAALGLGWIGVVIVVLVVIFILTRIL